jgi:RNA polymerase sigma factor (sigma-70 family)
MSTDSGNLDSGNDNPRSEGAESLGKSDVSPAPLLANFQPLIDRLHTEAGGYPWSLPRDRFVTALERSTAKRFGAEAVPPEKIEEYLGALHLQDLNLATACAEGCSEAWEFFVATYRPYLRSAAAVILRCPASSSSARDLADSLFADLYGLTEARRGDRSLFRYFHGRSSLRTWLRAVLAQRHIDTLRAGRRFTDLPDDVPGPPGEHIHRQARILEGAQTPPDPHRQRYVALFTRTLQVALGRLDSRDTERLRLYYADEQTLAEIGRKLGEHESSVSRNLDRIRRELRAEVERALREPRVTANSSRAESGLSEAEIYLCFEYASEDSPIDLDQIFRGDGSDSERRKP